MAADPQELQCCPGNLVCYMMRLLPGMEIKSSLEKFVDRSNLKAAFVMTAVGSVTKATLRFAHDKSAGNEIRTINEHLEILSLVGTINEGSHLHISLGDKNGMVIGGHVMGDLIVFTTCEIVLGNSAGWKITRPMDHATGFPELKLEKTNVETQLTDSQECAGTHSETVVKSPGCVFTKHAFLG